MLDKSSKYNTLNRKGVDYMKGSCHYDKKAKRWFIQLYWEGKKHRFWKHPLTGEPLWAKKSAEKQLNKIRTEVDEGYFNPKHWKPDSPMSIRVFATEWLDCISVEPKTLAGYKSSVNNYIIPYFQDKDIRHIRHNDLVKFYKWIKRSDKGKYNVMSDLRNMLRYAWRNEDLSNVPPFPKLSVTLPEITFLTMEQQALILNNIPDQDRPIFQFMMEYGVRPGEARAFQKDCIMEGEVVIKRAFSDNRLKEYTKTKLIRTFGITSYCQNIFDSLQSHLSPFVFVRSDGKPYTSKDLNRLWHDAEKKAGFKIKMYNGVRHSLGCQMLNDGFDMDLVRQQLGHTNCKMTQRYAKRSNKVLTDALEGRRNKIVEINKKSVNSR